MTVRSLVPVVEADRLRTMVFIAGPRQVGKTTLAKSLPGLDDGYRNWDVAVHRWELLAEEMPTSELWVFDEIHKYHRWRNWLKGVWDGRRDGQRILVTGSARLGGFPEPFFGGSERQARRWSRDYGARLVREEVVDLERIQDLGSLELLLQRLPSLVGSLLSINGLREDLQTTHKTLSRWLDVLERFYAIFRISPIGTPKIRAIKKAQKHYHWDWSVVTDEGARFENVIGSHLLERVHWQQDVEGRNYELRYFRDTDSREVDFVMVDGQKPILLVECKLGDDVVDKNLKYLHGKFPKANAWQVSQNGKKDFVSPGGVRVASATELLRTLV